MEEIDQEKIEEIKDLLISYNSDFVNESLIKDNKCVFYYNDKIYRVRMPNQRQQSEADHEKYKLYGKLIKTQGYYLKNPLVKILKETQEIDISDKFRLIDHIENIRSSHGPR